jgi:sugar lactone lactonase YvrE
MRHLSIFFLAAGMALCPMAHGFVTAPDFNGRESRIESGSIHGLLGVAVDGNGNLYLAQSNGILKETLSPDGAGYSETVVASLERVKQLGMAVDGVGNLYLGISGAVYKETLSDGSYTQSLIASDVKQPDWIAVDGRGNVYIADNADNRVLKETPSADHYTRSVVFPPAPGGAHSLDGLAVDSAGNVYLVSDGNVFKATPADGGYHTNLLLAGTYGPGLAVDGEGDLYVTVGSTQVLQERLSEGRYTQSTVATAHLPIPAGLAVDYSGNLYVGDLQGNRVLKEYATSAPLRPLTSGGTDATVSMLSAPGGVRTSH